MLVTFVADPLQWATDSAAAAAGRIATETFHLFVTTV